MTAQELIWLAQMRQVAARYGQAALTAFVRDLRALEPATAPSVFDRLEAIAWRRWPSAGPSNAPALGGAAAPGPGDAPTLGGAMVAGVSLERWNLATVTGAALDRMVAEFGLDADAVWNTARGAGKTSIVRASIEGQLQRFVGRSCTVCAIDEMAFVAEEVLRTVVAIPDTPQPSFRPVRQDPMSNSRNQAARRAAMRGR